AEARSSKRRIVSIRRSISRCVSGGRFGERLIMGAIPSGPSGHFMMGEAIEAGNRNAGLPSSDCGICWGKRQLGATAMTETAAATAEIEAPSIGRRLSPAGGVAITGANLANPLSPAVRETILAAFRDHHVLVFRDQDLSNEEQLAFTLPLGAI